jgi:crossover junction endodeoxyribonuclease RusA
MILRFTVYGEAIPQGSMRAFTPKGARYPVVTGDNPRTKGWRLLVGEAANVALAALHPAERALLLEGVRVTLAFYLPRPQSLPKRRTAHTKAPDLDKLTRSCFDALTHIVWRDDSQVCELVAVKHYAGAGQPPHVNITVQATQGVDPVPIEQSLFELVGR